MSGFECTQAPRSRIGPVSCSRIGEFEHWCDELKAAGRWFLTNQESLRPSRGSDGVFPKRVDALWDSYLLFDRDAAWNTPNGLLS